MGERVLCILQVRMGSSRLPGKALADICGRPMLAHIIDRLRTAETIGDIVVATTTRPEDEAVVDLAEAMGVTWFRGPAEDVLGRVAQVALRWGTEVIAHASGDNPLVEPEIVDETVRRCQAERYDLAFMAGLPLGVGLDVFSKRALITSDRLAVDPAQREHVNAYIFDHLDCFRVGRLLPDEALREPDLRLTVDTEDDLRLMREIYRRLYEPGTIIHLRDVLDLYEAEPELFAINRHVRQLYVSESAPALRGL